MYSAIMSGLSKRAPFDVRFPFHYNYGGTLKTHINARTGLSKRAPYDVRFTFHYNYGGTLKTNNIGLVKTHMRPEVLVKTGTIWCRFGRTGLSKRAPFDVRVRFQNFVRFPFHNYGGTLKTNMRPELACQNRHHLMSVFLITATTWLVFCNNVGLVKTGTIWCPFSFSLQLRRYIKNTY